jgi:diguanylate cyclase (GGDEF)-like protein/PAS domain S-box-containing protein
MKLSIEQKVKISIAIALALLSAMGFAAYWSMRQLHYINKDYKQVDQVIHVAERLLSELKDTETGQRGYLLTGQKQYLEPYYSGIAASQQRFKQLSLLLGRQPRQVQAINALNALIRSKLAELELTIRLKQTKGTNAALQVVNNNQGKYDMDKIRVAIQDMETDIRGQQKVHESKIIDSIQAIAPALGGFGLFGLGSMGMTVFVIDRDLKRRYHLEAKLKKSEEHYRSVVVSMTEGVIVQNAQGKILDCNDSAAAIAGLPRDQIIGRTSRDPIWNVIHEDGTPVMGENHPSLIVLRTGQPQSNVVMGFHQPNDDLRWLSTNSEPLWNADKTQPEGVITTFSDITKRKWAEEQGRLVQILALEIGMAKDLTSALQAVLKTVSKIRGFAIGEAWIPCPDDNVLKFNSVWHPNTNNEEGDCPFLLSQFTQKSKSLTFALGKGLPGRVWLSKTAEWQADVSQLPEVLFHRCVVAQEFGIKAALGIPVLANREVLAVLVFFKIESAARDDLLIESLATVSTQLSLVLQRKRAEEALRENELRLRLAMEGSGDGFWNWNIAIGDIYLSPQWLGMLGYAVGELPLKVSTWEKLIHPEDYLWVTKLLQAHLGDSSIPYRLEYRLLTKAGDWKWMANYGKVMEWDETGQPLRMAGVHRDIHHNKQAALALQKSEAEFRALFGAMHDLVVIRDAEGRCIRVLANHSQNLVKPQEALLGKTLHETFPEKQADLLLNSIHQALTLQETVMCDCSFNLKDEIRWFSIHMSPLPDNTVMAVIRDISDRKRLEQELFREKELAQVTLHSIGDAVITTDAEGNIQYFNPVAETLTGWSQAQTYGLPLIKVFNIINENTRELVDNPVDKALREGRIVALANHTLLIARDGREIPIEDSAAPIRDYHGNLIGAVLVFHDVTQNRSLTKQLSWQASHDPLTQLVNRREFEQRVEQSLESAQNQGVCHALCYLDLDQFKIVNDTCGHGAGDELLRQVTALLQAQVRKTDTLARLGGDEFGVLLHQCPLPQALRIANDMRECIQAFRFVWEEQTFKIGASIGLISINAHSESLSSLMSFADSACYAAKNKGRNRVHVFQTDDQDLLQQRGEMQWATRLSRALEEDRFCLYYQTIAAIFPTQQNGEHYEVLLRLRDESGHLVSPMTFIPAAERYGLMHLIDRWVIRTLFTTQGQHYRDIWNQCTIEGNSCNALYAINLSGASINDEQFVEFLHEQFRLHQVPPQLICFEITETMAIANLTKARQFIHELHQLGCCFALDDFGSGMSSFGYLKNLPVDYLKIDGEFIRHMVDTPVDEAMVEAMTRIGHVMGIKIIAEFVENDAILERLKVLSVDYAQGYGIAKPLPLLENQQSKLGESTLEAII